MSFELHGDWKEASRILEHADSRFHDAANKALMMEAHAIRGHIIKNLTTGGQHAGKPFAPPSQLTLVVRKFTGFGGSKPLMVTGALRSSVTVMKDGGGVFVGVKRGGKGGTNFASLHEFGGGPWQRPMTDKQRRFLAAAFAQAGIPFGQGAGGGGVIRTKIPARPFIGPVIEKFAKSEDVQKRFWENVSRLMNGDLGKPG